ncbi:MAG: tetratricopeptide repeat protein [Anaerolineales bacterium]|nr:tetratricopeptide repeat protein [Anaerolineales bacterium]
MKNTFRSLILILLLGSLVVSCLSTQSKDSNQSPTSSARIGFNPGDPTSTPPGSEISDTDFQVGVQAYRDKDFEKVRELMEKVAARYPQLAPPHWYLGRAYYESGNYEMAMEQMEKALFIDPNYALAYADRGLIYSVLGDDEAALTDYQRALNLDPSLAKVRHNLGFYYFEQGKWELAYKEYDIAIHIDPNRYVTWGARGDVLSTLGRYSECVASADTAISINNEYWPAYLVRSLCYAESGDAQAAFSDISVVTSNNPEDSSIMAQSCFIAQKINFSDEAIEFCTQSILLTPDDFKSYINRGNVYFNKGEYDKALEDFTKALEFGEAPAAYFNRGNVYMKTYKFNEAIEDYQHSLDLLPRGKVYYALGFAYLQINEFKNASLAFEQGDTLEPWLISDEIRLYGKARAYFGLEQLETALELCTELIEKYQNGEAYYFRARTYEELESYAEAIQDYNTFIEMANGKLEDSYIQMLANDANNRRAELISK